MMSGGHDVGRVESSCENLHERRPEPVEHLRARCAARRLAPSRVAGLAGRRSRSRSRAEPRLGDLRSAPEVALLVGASPRGKCAIAGRFPYRAPGRRLRSTK